MEVRVACLCIKSVRDQTPCMYATVRFDVTSYSCGQIAEQGTVPPPFFIIQVLSSLEEDFCSNAPSFLNGATSRLITSFPQVHLHDPNLKLTIRAGP